jgi:predicted HAD superfamily phosphohydrolase
MTESGTMKLICFDLEGPLSPQDNAYELMKLFPDGGKIFEVISRYDDLLTLENRPDYEPGDTLALIAPFLAYHRIGERVCLEHRPAAWHTRRECLLHAFPLRPDRPIVR